MNGFMTQNGVSGKQPIGKLIQARRKAQGLTQEALARKADVAYTSLTKIESGVIKNPSLELVSRLARALDISLDALLVPKTYHGKGSLKVIFEDALSSMRHAGEFMCISGIDERNYLRADRKALLTFITELKSRGFTQKLLCSADAKTFLEGEHLEYRTIPKEHFNATPIYVYGNKVTILLWGPPQQVVIMENAALADAYRKQFLYIWEHAAPVSAARRRAGSVKA